MLIHIFLLNFDAKSGESGIQNKRKSSTDQDTSQVQPPIKGLLRLELLKAATSQSKWLIRAPTKGLIGDVFVVSSISFRKAFEIMPKLYAVEIIISSQQTMLNHCGIMSRQKITHYTKVQI